MNRSTLFIVLLVLSKLLFSQCDVSNFVFQSGERATYNVYYKLGFLWFNAAEVEFNVKATINNGNKAFHFVSKGNSLPSYDWLFKVRDVFESKADSATLSPYYFSRNTLEAGYKVNNQYVFDYTGNRIFSQIENSKVKKYKDTLSFYGCTFDVLTAIYACRNLNFGELNPNDTVPLSMVIENKIHPLFIRYQGTEQIVLKNERVFNTLKFSILLVEGTVFSGGEDMTVWVTNDKNRVPIRVEAKILVGSIIATLNTTRGLKWKLSSEINNFNHQN